MSLKCDQDNCFKNIGGECFAAGVVNDEPCEDYLGEPRDDRLECNDCGCFCVPELMDDYGRCPTCNGTY